MIGAGHWLTARFGLPLVLSEAGSSAGLNLLWDRFALDTGGWRRGPPDGRVPNSIPTNHVTSRMPACIRAFCERISSLEAHR
jgi:hypothetical protein